MNTTPSADKIEQVAFGFMVSKVLFSAIELGLLSELAKEPLALGELQKRCGLHLQPRSTRDFFDALVALGMLDSAGELYSNTPDTGFYLDRLKPTYIGNRFQMRDGRVYLFAGSLAEGLKTGNPQNEIKAGEDLFAAIYENPSTLRNFLSAITGYSVPPALAIAQQFLLAKYKTFADIGAAQGGLAVQVAQANPHLAGVGFDSPAVRPLFEEYVGSFGLLKQRAFRPGDFFKEPPPQADVLGMGLILHDWSLGERRILLKKVYEALPDGGALIVYERLIDDERRKNLAGLFMNLFMLLETQDGFDCTSAGCRELMRETGFKKTRVEESTGIEPMVIGIK